MLRSTMPTYTLTNCITVRNISKTNIVAQLSLLAAAVSAIVGLSARW